MRLAMAIILLVLTAPTAFACAASAVIIFSQDPEVYMDRADLIVKARVQSVDNTLDGAQLVHLEVVEQWKGPDMDRVTLRNQLITTCDSPVPDNGETYVFFAIDNDEDGEFMMRPSAFMNPDLFVARKRTGGMPPASDGPESGLDQ